MSDNDTRLTAGRIGIDDDLDKQRMRRARLSRLERVEFERILQLPVMDYVDHERFAEPDVEQVLFAPAQRLPMPNCDWYHPAMEALGDTRRRERMVTPVLTARQEKALFLQFNYARYCVAQLQRRLNDAEGSPREARELLFWFGMVDILRDMIVRYNLALVLAMARHAAASKLDYADMISRGNEVLLHAIAKFDVGRGFKFSTYACRSILKAFSRMGEKETRRRSAFPVSFDPEMERPDPNAEPIDLDLKDRLNDLREAWRENSPDLTPLERDVVKYRFALDDDGPERGMTLSQVGQLIGYTKERVRQIQLAALAKIARTLANRQS